MLRRTIILMAVMAFGAIGVAPAEAHQSPPGCFRNALALDITKDKTMVRTGDVITYGVYIGNDGQGSCDYTNVTVTFTTPGGQPQTVATIPNLPAFTQLQQIGTVRYTVPPLSGMATLVAAGHAAGTLHDNAAREDNGSVDKDLSTAAIVPTLALTKTGSSLGGVAPQTITYTYALKNTSPVDPNVLPDVPISNPVVSDNLCAPLTYTGGDNGNGVLNVGETWTYSCSKTYAAAGCYTNVANASGTAPNNSPVMAGPASWTACVTAPPPAAAVQGVTATKCVTLPTKQLRVRAHELATVRVRVRLNGKNIAKSLVHVTGAGVKTSGRTNKNGIVTFHLRPKRSGTLSIQSDQCAVAARLSVKPARQVVSPALPRVTG
jgi:uncharacterized repeat protein (TIGR01451 family)